MKRVRKDITKRLQKIRKDITKRLQKKKDIERKAKIW